MVSLKETFANFLYNEINIPTGIDTTERVKILGDLAVIADSIVMEECILELGSK